MNQQVPAPDLSLRTSDRCHWCGNPFFLRSAGISVIGSASGGRIATPTLRRWLAMTGFAACTRYALSCFKALPSPGGEGARRADEVEAFRLLGGIVQTRSADTSSVSPLAGDRGEPPSPRRGRLWRVAVSRERGTESGRTYKMLQGGPHGPALLLYNSMALPATIDGR